MSLFVSFYRSYFSVELAKYGINLNSLKILKGYTLSLQGTKNVYFFKNQVYT